MLVQVAAVTIVGFTEGSGHVNWRVVATHVMWWFMGFFAVLLATYALVAQGQARTLSQHLQKKLAPHPPLPLGATSVFMLYGMLLLFMPCIPTQPSF